MLLTEAYYVQLLQSHTIEVGLLSRVKGLWTDWWSCGESVDKLYHQLFIKETQNVHKFIEIPR
jgi:hypothetical protein